MSARQIVVRGLVAGLIGATILAVWFFVIDTIEGRPFFPLAFLASYLAHVEGVDRSVALITLYTVLHYLAFFAVGLLAAWVMSRLETCPSLLLGLVLGFVPFDLVFYLASCSPAWTWWANSAGRRRFLATCWPACSSSPASRPSSWVSSPSSPSGCLGSSAGFPSAWENCWRRQ